MVVADGITAKELRPSKTGNKLFQEKPQFRWSFKTSIVMQVILEANTTYWWLYLFVTGSVINSVAALVYHQKRRVYCRFLQPSNSY